MKEVTIYFGKEKTSEVNGGFPFFTNKGKFYDFKLVLNGHGDMVLADSINRFVPIAFSDINALIKALKRLKKKAK